MRVTAEFTEKPNKVEIINPAYITAVNKLAKQGKWETLHTGYKDKLFQKRIRHDNRHPIHVRATVFVKPYKKQISTQKLLEALSSFDGDLSTFVAKAEMWEELDRWLMANNMLDAR